MKIYQVEDMPTTDPMVLPVCETPLDLDLAWHIGIRIHQEGYIAVPCTGPHTLEDIYKRSINPDEPISEKTQRAYLLVLPDDDATLYRLQVLTGPKCTREDNFLPQMTDGEKEELHSVITSWLCDKVVRYQDKYGILQDYRSEDYTPTILF